MQIASTTVKSQETMKILGITFDYKLSWEQHIRQTVAKANSKLSVLRKIRKNFTKDQFLKVLTAQYFSILYYGSPVWLTSSTKKSLWKLVHSAHYKALRVAVHDIKARMNREKLDILCQRASPKQWSKYAIASIVIKCLTSNKPTNLVNFLRETMYIDQRFPDAAKFYDNSRRKIGKQKLGNNLGFMQAIKDDWLGQDLDNHKIRRILKKTFFGYFLLI